jgi:hypothetical protein
MTSAGSSPPLHRNEAIATVAPTRDGRTHPVILSVSEGSQNTTAGPVVAAEILRYAQDDGG